MQPKRDCIRALGIGLYLAGCATALALIARAHDTAPCGAHDLPDRCLGRKAWSVGR